MELKFVHRLRLAIRKVSLFVFQQSVTHVFFICSELNCQSEFSVHVILPYLIWFLAMLLFWYCIYYLCFIFFFIFFLTQTMIFFMWSTQLLWIYCVRTVYIVSMTKSMNFLYLFYIYIKPCIHIFFKQSNWFCFTSYL